MSPEADRNFVVMMTAGSESEALKIARALVEERLAACCSLLPRIRSIYRWQGEVCDEAETLLLAKTTSARLDALTRRVLQLHSYDCPEVVALEIGDGSRPYLEWLAAQCSPERGEARDSA